MKFPKILLERFSLIAAVFSIVVIYIGFVILFFYYHYFDIYIFDYISISEIVTTSFSSIFSVLFSIAVAFFILENYIFKAWKVRSDLNAVHQTIRIPKYVVISLNGLIFLYIGCLYFFPFPLEKVNFFVIKIIDLAFLIIYAMGGLLSFLVVSSLYIYDKDNSVNKNNSGYKINTGYQKSPASKNLPAPKNLPAFRKNIKILIIIFSLYFL